MRRAAAIVATQDWEQILKLYQQHDAATLEARFKVKVVCRLVLSSASFESMREFVAAFHQGLAEIGYVEGRNVVAEYRWAENDYDRLPAFAADLMRRQVTVIALLGSTPATLAAKAATATIPIVFVIGTDPVRGGITESLARPAGNLTGTAIIRSELMAKSLSLTHELIPMASTIAVLINPANAVQSENEIRDAEAAARILGVRVIILRASRPGDIELAFAQLASKSADALVVDGENSFVAQRDLIVALATRHAIPTMYPDPDFTAIGGLMSYGAYPAVASCIAGAYVGRILKGRSPPICRCSRSRVLASPSISRLPRRSALPFR